MAQSNLELVLNLVDNASKGVKAAQKNIEKSLESAADAARKVGIGMTAVGGAIIGVAAMSVKAAQEAESVQARLETTIRNVTNSWWDQGGSVEFVGDKTEIVTALVKDQVAALSDQAAALQRVGVVGDDTIKMGQSQLATFNLSTDAIMTLTPALLDMAVANDGANVSMDSLKNLGNLVGKVMTGATGALSKYGVTLSDVQAEQLKSGDEMERAAVLAEILKQNFGGLNEAMRNTTEGQIAALKENLGDLSELIGGVFLPVLSDAAVRLNGIVQRVFEWQAKNPELFNSIVQITVAIGGLMTVLGPILVVMPNIVASFKMLGVILTGPAGLAIALAAAITSLVLQFVSLDDILGFLGEKFAGFNITIGSVQEAIGSLKDWVMQLWATVSESAAFNELIGLFMQLWDVIKLQLFPALIEFYESAIKPLMPILESLAKLVGTIVYAAFKIFLEILTLVVSIISSIINVASGLADVFTTVLVPVIDTVIKVFDGFVKALSGVFDWVSKVFNMVTKLVNKLSELASFGGDTFKSTLGKLFSSGNRAVGGSVAAGSTYKVGENGPEYFTPSTNGHITPAGRGGTNINVTITGNNISNEMDLDSVATKVGDTLLRQLRFAYKV